MLQVSIMLWCLCRRFGSGKENWLNHNLDRRRCHVKIVDSVKKRNLQRNTAYNFKLAPASAHTKNPLNFSDTKQRRGTLK
jgi:hypothetical protein